VGGTLFMAGQDMPDRIPVLVQGIVDVEYRSTGKSEHGIDTLFLEASDDDFCSVQLHANYSPSHQSVIRLSCAGKNLSCHLSANTAPVAALVTCFA
jgi:hypothetical protein